MPMIIFLIFSLFLWPSAANSFSSDYAEALPKWLHLLETGNPQEKRLALSNLWFLQYPEVRKDPAVFDPIFAALKDRNPDVREAAAASLKRIGELSHGRCQESRIVPSLIQALEDRSAGVRGEAAKGLGTYKDKRAVTPLVIILKDPDPWVRLNAAFSLGELKAQEAVNALLDLLDDDSDWRYKFVQQESLIALRKIGGLDQQILQRLKKKFRDDYTRGQLMAILSSIPIPVAIGRDAPPSFRPPGETGVTPSRMEKPKVEALIQSLKNGSPTIRAQSAEALGKTGDPRAVDPLVASLRDPSPRVKEKVLTSLGNFADERILDQILEFILTHPDPSLTEPAAQAYQSVARKTSRERAFVYRQQGERYTTNSRSGVPQQTSHLERIVQPTALKKLLQALQNPSPDSRLKVLKILNTFEDPRIEETLIPLLVDPSPQLRKKAVYLLKDFGTGKSVPPLLKTLQDRDPEIRMEAARALGILQAPGSLEPLLERLKDPDDQVKAAVLGALGNFSHPQAAEATIHHLGAPSSRVRNVALLNLSRNPEKRAVESLIPLLGDPDWNVSTKAAEILGRLGDARAVGPLIDALDGKVHPEGGGDRTYALRRSAAAALGQMKAKEAVPALIRHLQDRQFRIHAMGALGLIQDQRAIPALREFLNDEDPNLRHHASTAIRQITYPSPAGAIPKLVVPYGKGPPLPQPVSKDGSQQRGYLLRWQEPGKPPPEMPPTTRSIPSSPPKKPELQWDADFFKVSPLDFQTLLPQLKADSPRLRREAVEALGETANPRAVEYVIPLLQDPNEYVRQAAARALAKLRDPIAIGPLSRCLTDPDESVKWVSVWALGEIRDPRAIEPLSQALSDPAEKIRSLSFEALMKLPPSPTRKEIAGKLFARTLRGDPSAELFLWKIKDLEGEDLILALMEDPGKDRRKTIKNYISYMAGPNDRIRKMARTALMEYPDRSLVLSELAAVVQSGGKLSAAPIALLGEMKDSGGFSSLIHVLQNRRAYSNFQVETAIHAVNHFNEKRTAIPLLREILIDFQDSPEARGSTAKTLGQWGDQEAIQPLMEILQNRNEPQKVRLGACVALGDLRTQRAADSLIEVLKNKNEDLWLRISAIHSLAKIGDKRAIEPMREALKDPSDYIRNAAKRSLQEMENPR